MNTELLKTADGSFTLFVKELNEPYHSVHGAITESRHVFIANGFRLNNKDPRTVLEVGLGTGLNCLLTAVEAEKQKVKVNYIGVEKYPVNDDFAGCLNYPGLIGGSSDKVFDAIWAAKWGEEVQINSMFNLLKLKIDLLSDVLPCLPGFDVVFFDAFGPAVQPAMWQPRIFSMIYERCNPGAVFTTYSAKGQVRRDLINAGFQMKRLPGPPGKKEMLSGIKEG